MDREGFALGGFGLNMPTIADPVPQHQSRGNNHNVQGLLEQAEKNSGLLDLQGAKKKADFKQLTTLEDIGHGSLRGNNHNVQGLLEQAEKNSGHAFRPRHENQDEVHRSRTVSEDLDSAIIKLEHQEAEARERLRVVEQELSDIVHRKKNAIAARRGTSQPSNNPGPVQCTTHDLLTKIKTLNTSDAKKYSNAKVGSLLGVKKAQIQRFRNNKKVEPQVLNTMLTNAHRLPPLPVLLPLEQEPWYFGRISRDRAEDLLQHGREGEFLVRDSESNPGDLSISMCGIEKNKHFKVQNVDGQLKIGKRTFMNMNALINHYTTNPIFSSPTEELYLTGPLPK